MFINKFFVRKLESFLFAPFKKGIGFTCGIMLKVIGFCIIL